MATVSFTQDVIISDEKMIKQLEQDLKTPTYDISKVKPVPNAVLPEDVAKKWFTRLGK